MILKLNRNKIFVIGISIILAFLLINRVYFISQSEITTGEVVRNKSWSSNVVSLRPYQGSGSYSAPVIQFKKDSLEISFQGPTNLEIQDGEHVQVIYKISDPTDAELYSFVGFWFSPLLYCIIPLLFLTAATFSFLNSSDIITIDFKNIISKKK